MMGLFAGWRRVVVLLIVATEGCTNANVALNRADLRLEDRRINQTRAAVFAQIRPLGSRSAAPTTQDVAVLADAGPAPARGAALPLDRDGCFVGLALSGGGSRSANFAAACMFQFERLGLLQKVDYISSVSGGSLTAAYYCLNGSDWNPAMVQKKLTHPFASDLMVQTFFLPWNWVAMTATDWDRSDVLAGIFRDVVFNRDGRPLTYHDLRADRPRLLINATDLQSGRRFVFSNESFDQLNSDLSRYPIAYAVTASAAVPVILHPVTLRDYSTRFAQYRHLVDGGVSDNLGIQTLLETYAAQLATARSRRLPDPYPNGAVFIVVDAHTQFDAELSSKGDVGLVESLQTALGLTSTSLLNRVSSATLADIIVRSSPDDVTASQIRKQIDDLNDNGYLDMRDRSGHEVRVVYLSLAQVNDLPDLPFLGFSETLNSISTYLNISEREAYHLYQAADLLVREKFEARLRRIVVDLDRERAGDGIRTHDVSLGKAAFYH